MPGGVKHLLSRAAKRLKAAGIDAPALTAELLMAHTLGVNRAGVIARAGDILDDDTARRFGGYVARRESREPLEYITGGCEFLGRSFTVGPEVLIPRPETELLCMEAERFLLEHNAGEAAHAADVCTGSGCIAATLALDVPNLRVHATDISPDALRLARDNAGRLGVSDSVRFHEGDLTEPLIKAAPGGFNVIVSNPPYVPSGELGGLQEEVKREPVLALDGGTDGLDFVRRIIDGASGLLRPGGRLMMEIGIGQSGEVGVIIDGTDGLNMVGFIKDHAGIERIVVAEKETLWNQL